MTPGQALEILNQASDMAPLPGPAHRQIKEAVQALAPIVAAHEAKAKAEAENDKP